MTTKRTLRNTKAGSPTANAPAWLRVESGVYETRDGMYQVERISAYGEYDSHETVWVLNRINAQGQWEEITEAETKRELVAYCDSLYKSGRQ